MKGQIVLNKSRLAYDWEGAGPWVLLIAGLDYGLWFWDWIRPHLGGLRMVSFDNRGVGDSDLPRGPYDTVEMAKDALGLIRTLNVQRAHVVGHSLGGMVAQELALMAPEKIGKLVLVSTAHGGPGTIPGSPEALSAMLDRKGDLGDVLRRGIGIATAEGFLDKHPAVYNQILAKRLVEPVPPEVYELQLQAGAQHDSEARLGEICMQTLALTGAHDRIVPPGNAELLAKKIPNARLEVVPGAGHLLPIEKPREMGELVRRFLGA